MRIPKDVLNSLVRILTNHTNRSTDNTNYHYKHEIEAAIQHQEKIGVDMLARGYISKQWLYTIHPTRNPTRTMNKIQRLIWMEFFEPLWKNRNDLLHQTTNLHTQAKDDKLTRQIQWYCNNCHLLFARQDMHMADNIDLATLQTQPIKMKKEWIRHFKVAEDAFTKEQQINKAHQKLIREYMITRPRSTTTAPQQRATRIITRPTRSSTSTWDPPRCGKIWVTIQKRPKLCRPQWGVAQQVTPQKQPPKTRTTNQLPRPAKPH